VWGGAHCKKSGRFPCSVGRFPCSVGRFPCSVGRFPCSVGRFPCFSRQVSLIGVRRVSLAPGIPASHTNPLPDSPSYPIGVRGQGGRGGAYCPPSLSPIMGRDGEKGDNPPSGSTTVTHSPWSCQQALSPSFCSHLATVQRLCSQGDKGQADF
jgi:hypothetical protein